MSFSEQPHSPNQPPIDARLQPTPDYGTLGPGADIALPPASRESRSLPKKGMGSWIAVFAGVIAALVVSNLRSAGGRVGDSARNSEPKSALIRTSFAKETGNVEKMSPQAQAERLLELAVSQSDGAVEQISTHVKGWQGRISWSPQLANLTTAALNSSDRRVRESGIEVQLAAYGLNHDSESLNELIHDADSTDHARKIWALWTLGAMANRGVEPERATDILVFHLHDADEDSRRWTVEGLALVGSDATIPLLLDRMHDDPSPAVRERAACSLAESGMLTREQRMTAVPRLIEYSEDPSLDAQTRAWAFQALSDITGEHLPNDSYAWRQWYATRNHQ